MKKILSLVSAIALALPIFAGTVTFKPSDFSGQGTATSGSAVSATKGGVTVECNKAYGATDALRCYKDGVLTITSTSNIQILDFTFQSASGKYYNGGLAEGNNLTAQITVNDLTWTYTMASQGRITELVVTIDGEGVEPTPVDTITVTEALARLNDADGNKGECYVKGKVLSIITNNVETYGNISYWMADTQNPGDSIQAYRMKAANNADYPNAAAVEFVEGDEILVYAAGLAMYHNNNTNQDIPELNTGYYVRTLSGAAITTLDWSYADAAYENGNWTITIAASSAAGADNMKLVFPSTVTNGIAGYHSLAASQVNIGGNTAAVTAGYIKLTYRSISSNNYNVYEVEAKAVSGDNAYRVIKEIEISAFDADGEEIILSADRPFTPKANDTITCAQAREYALSLGSGEGSPFTVTVRGFITDMFSNGVTFWMDDKEGDAKTIQAYSCTMPSGVSLDKGAEVYVTGAVKNYNGTPEVDHGTVTVISGGKEIVAQEVTVAEAVAVAEALAANATSDGYYAITGFISGIVTEYSDQYGNISFWMSDNANDNGQVFQAYRAKCDAATAAKLVVGVKVKVTDKIKHFHQDAQEATEEQPAKEERTVYETNGGGTVEYLSGAGVEDINVNATAVKFIENGRIIIIRNGVRYDVQGRIAE